MKKVIAMLLVTLAAALFAAPALADNIFQFEVRSVTLFEEDTVETALKREGTPAEGEVKYSTGSAAIATIDEDGIITGVKKGSTTVAATVQSGKRSWKTTLKVNVLRRVNNVTLNTSEMRVYESSDPMISDLLWETTDKPVILMTVGASLRLRSTCTPSDASSRDVTYTSSDEGVVKISGGQMKAVQAGECELTAKSTQNPEVTDEYHVLVIRPVTKITVSAKDSTVYVGETLQLTAECAPENAGIQEVTWSSRMPSVATVDENGLVTGIKKGTVNIEATAADGSGKVGRVSLTVAQLPEEITLKNTELSLAAGQNATLTATVLPTNANDRRVLWSSSDESVATVNKEGRVHAVGRGECFITAACAGNPEVETFALVRVIQRVTSITFIDKEISLPIHTEAQLAWYVLPEDASDQEVTFTSSNKRIATVDEFGVVTALQQGTANITATAVDGSQKQGRVKVTVTQPVEGVTMQRGTYRVQTETRTNVRAVITPSNANNTNMSWYISDSSVASISSGGKNVCTVTGLRQGTVTLTGVTEDGGFSASTTIVVGDFNRAVVVDDVYVENEQIRLSLRNRSDFTMARVYFTINCYDAEGRPLVCNVDGVSTSFNGYYPLLLGPDEITEHYRFTFRDYMQPLSPIYGVEVAITGWMDTDGTEWSITNEALQPRQSFRQFVWNVPEVTQTPDAQEKEIYDEDNEDAVG